MVGFINKIETLSTKDGPGLRLVVFMQGCPLRCIFCHNPEMLSTNGGEAYTPEELVAFILKYKVYFESGGGVTFSGGEPLLQTPFLIAVCKLLKKENIHICLDTSGIGLSNKKIFSLIDIVLMDIKYINSEGYMKITGVNKFEESISFIEESIKQQKEIWFREVIVPGINDSVTYIKKLKDFVNKYPFKKIELLPFHTMAFSKYENLDIPNKLGNIASLDSKKLEILNDELNK